MQDKHSRSRSLFLDSLSLFPWKNYYYYYYYYHHTVRRLILCPCTVLLKKIIRLGSGPTPPRPHPGESSGEEQGGCNILTLLLLQKYGEKARGSRGEQMDLWSDVSYSYEDRTEIPLYCCCLLQAFYFLYVCSPFVNMPAKSDENGKVRKIFP